MTFNPGNLGFVFSPEGQRLSLTCDLSVRDFLPPLLLSYLFCAQMFMSCCVTSSQYSGSSFQCSSVTQKMKGHVQGRSKNSSWATDAKALTKPRTCVFPDLNNQESCRALDMSTPDPLENRPFVPGLFIFSLLPQTYSRHNSRTRVILHKVIYYKPKPVQESQSHQLF